jgi:hypothetical protein
MLKIERGWEGQSLDQIETMSATTGSNPNSPMVSNKDARRRSLSSEGYMTSPITGIASSASRSAFQNSLDASNHFQDEALYKSTQQSRLAPAPMISSPSGAASAIRKQQHRRSLNNHLQRRPPALNRSSNSANTGDGAPRTPTDGRFPGSGGQSASESVAAGPTNQAEKDAIDTLLFMSSPNNSSNMKRSKPSNQLRGLAGLQRQSSGKRVNFLID